MNRLWIIAALIFVSACSKEGTMPLLSHPVPSQSLDNTDRGLSLFLEENIFQGSPATIITKLRNESQLDYHYGDFYSLEMKKDGEWYVIKYSDAIFYSNQNFKDFGSIFFAHSETAQQFSIDDLKITLLPGEYRLLTTPTTKVDGVLSHKHLTCHLLSRRNRGETWVSNSWFSRGQGLCQLRRPIGDTYIGVSFEMTA